MKTILRAFILLLILAFVFGCEPITTIDLTPDPQDENPQDENDSPPSSLVELTAAMHLAFLDNFNAGLNLSPPTWVIPDTLGTYQYTKADGTYILDAIMDSDGVFVRFIGSVIFTDYPVLGCTFEGELTFTYVYPGDGTTRLDSHGYFTVANSEYVDLYLSIHWQYRDATGEFFELYGIVEADGTEYDLVDFGIF